MKDFLVAEYKTILLVLLFCGGVFSWFYMSELQKAEAKEEETEETWNYTCLEPGRMVRSYQIGQAAPAIDETWQAEKEALGVTSLKKLNDPESLVINVRDNKIQSIEFFPAAEDKTCADDFTAWKDAGHGLIHESLNVGYRTYNRYDGITDVQCQTGKDTFENCGYIIMPLEPPKP